MLWSCDERVARLNLHSIKCEQWHQDPKCSSGDAEMLEAKGCSCSWTQNRLSLSLSLCRWHPSVMWRNKCFFSCANISVRMDSGPWWPASCKPSQPPPAHMLPHMGPTVHKHKMTHPCVRKAPPRSLGEQYQYAGIYVACVAPDPTLTSPLLPCPHILILFGMCCQATVSINTAPGNSVRKPP